MLFTSRKLACTNKGLPVASVSYASVLITVIKSLATLLPLKDFRALTCVNKGLHKSCTECRPTLITVMKFLTTRWSQDVDRKMARVSKAFRKYYDHAPYEYPAYYPMYFGDLHNHDFAACKTVDLSKAHVKYAQAFTQIYAATKHTSCLTRLTVDTFQECIYDSDRIGKLIAKQENLEHLSLNIPGLFTGSNLKKTEQVLQFAEDLTKCTKLKHLHLGNLIHTSWAEDMENASFLLAERIGSFSKLESLTVDNLRYFCANIITVPLLMADRELLVHLTLTRVAMTEVETVMALAHILAETCKNLESVDLSWNEFKDAGFAALLPKLSECSTLKTLKLTNNSLTCASIETLVEQNQWCTRLTKLDLRNNKIAKPKDFNWDNVDL